MAIAATIHDARGPRWARLVLPALGIVGIAAGLLGRALYGGQLGPDFYEGLALFLAAPLLIGRHGPRRASLVLLPGAVEVRDAGLVTQTLRGRDLVGVSTCASVGGVTVALQRRRREPPVLLEVASDEEAGAVRDALGIGRRGAGTLSFSLLRRRIDVVGSVNLALGSLSAGALAYATLTGGTIASFAGAPFVYLVIVLPLLYVGSQMEGASTLELGDSHVRLTDGRSGPMVVPYDSIVSASMVGEWLVLDRGRKKLVSTRVHVTRRGAHGVSEGELAHVLMQLRSAIRRARGEAPNAPPQVPAAAAALARAKREPVRSWLQRLESLAVGLEQRSAYRSAELGENELWSVLEDHDASPDARAGSARVLARIAQGKGHDRLERAVRTVRVDETRALIRIAVETESDVERATTRLEELRDRGDGRW